MGKGHGRLHERTQVPPEEMARRWEKALGCSHPTRGEGNYADGRWKICTSCGKRLWRLDGN